MHNTAFPTLCFLCSFLFNSVSAATKPDTTAPAQSVAKSEDFILRDEKRGRDIECRAHFPATGEKLPLIIFSHGFGSDRAAFGPVAQHWAAHGYVIVLPSHLDGAGRSAPKTDGKPAKGSLREQMKGGGLAGLMSTKVEARTRDVTFIMDSLDQLAAKAPALKGRIDASRMGVGGHSLGAYTAMLLGGVTADIGEQKARSFADARVRCILPISAQGTGQQGLTDSSWAKLKLPMLTMTGSRDQGAGGQGPEWKKEPFKFSPPGDKFLVFIQGANHVSFAGAAGVVDCVKPGTLAFWDAYLKDDEKAKQSLKTGAVFGALKDKATIESK